MAKKNSDDEMKVSLREYMMARKTSEDINVALQRKRIHWDPKRVDVEN